MQALFKMKQHTNKGTSKVLFSCHKDDFDKYFNELTDEILAIQDCSIYYLEDQNYTPEDIEDYKVQLSEFNLFVFPITFKFLSEDNRAKDIDFKYAKEKNYPILPILVEPGLYDMFNNFNTIQVLDKTTNDSTQDPYKVKLEKYLKSVLLDDKTVKKIRDAFDAYIFLSYRKKDRKYAQEVMSLIHKNDFMRDIAIWYDEFLTPGENFNDEISDNLLKSKLMALVVTPNINERYGEKGNYVIEEEYPHAIKENKPVLPIEAVETDKQELQNNFKDIQNPINKDNYDEITKFFKDFIIKNGLDENDNDPEHLYFIGLAYLNGIDTDRDPEKAIKILEKAEELFYEQYSDRDCDVNYEPIPWASKTLVNIYENGIGTTINFKKAISHQKKIFNFLWSNLHHDDSLYNAFFRYEFSRLKLDDLYVKNGEYDAALRQLATNFRGNDFDFMPTLYVDYIYAYINDKVGNHEEAKKIYADINKFVAKRNKIGLTYSEINEFYEASSYIYNDICDDDELMDEIEDDFFEYFKEAYPDSKMCVYARDLFGLTREELNYLHFSDAIRSAIQRGTGLNYCYAGDTKQGVSLIEDCIKKYGHDNYDNDFALAEAYCFASNYKESLAIIDKVSKYYAKKYEANHPKILECEFIIAKCYKGLGKYNDANNILAKLIEKQELIYGKDSVFTQSSRDLYNENLVMTGNYEVLDVLEESCNKTFTGEYKKHLEDYNKFNNNVFDKYNKFIELLLKTNNYEKAASLIEKLYFRRNKVNKKQGGAEVYLSYLFTNPNDLHYEKVLGYLNVIKDKYDNVDKHKMSNLIAISLLNINNPKAALDLLQENGCLKDKEASEYLTSLQIQCKCLEKLNETEGAIQSIKDIILALSNKLTENHIDLLSAKVEYFRLLINSNKFDYEEYEQIYSLGVVLTKYLKVYDGELDQSAVDNSIFDGYATHKYYGEFYNHIYHIMMDIRDIVFEFYKQKREEKDIENKKFLKLEREVGYLCNCSAKKKFIYEDIKHLVIPFEELYKQRVESLGELNKATINLKVIITYWKNNTLGLGFYDLKNIIDCCETYKIASNIDDNDEMSLFALNVFFSNDGSEYTLFVHERYNDAITFFDSKDMMSKDEICELIKSNIKKMSKAYKETGDEDFLKNLEIMETILKYAFDIDSSK